MTHYFDFSTDGESRSNVSGPYADQSAAETAKAAIEAAFPTHTVGEVYEDAGSPEQSIPVVEMLISQGGVEYQVWTDGVSEAV